jgi:hypothetical protein
LKRSTTFMATATVMLAIAAFIGTASASAVTMCKENKNPCPAGQRYAKETVFKLKLPTGKEVVFVGATNVRCLASTAETKTKEEAGTPLLGTINAFGFGAECEGCKKVTALLLPYNTELAEAGGKWAMTVKSGGGGSPRFKMTECPPGGKEECTFGSTSFELEVTGGKPATVAANKVMLSLFAGMMVNCGLSREWSATYEISEAVEPGQKGVANPPVWPQKEP